MACEISALYHGLRNKWIDGVHKLNLAVKLKKICVNSITVYLVYTFKSTTDQSLNFLPNHILWL